MRGGGQRGGRVQGQGNQERPQGGKRQATTPVGGTYKDPRRNINGDEEYDEDEEWTEVVYNKPKSPNRQPSNVTPQDTAPAQSNTNTQRTFAEAVASTSYRRPSSTEAQTEGTRSRGLFKTAPPEGSMRDDITIEIRKVNGAPFKGSLHFKEAKYGIFQNCLQLNPSLIHGLRFGFSDFPVVKFKLKEKINIDAFQPMEYFDFKRDYTVGDVAKSDILECKIKGIRTEGAPVGENQDGDPSIRWVKVEWAEYSLEEHEILTWLDLFGVPAGPLSEDIHPDSDSESDPTWAGTYSIKMRLRTDIPQLLPMWGKRIRIYHRGIQKLCTNCYGAHARRNCRSAKVRWVDYVLRFMEAHRDIPPEYYGRWWKVVNDEFGEIINEDETPETENDDPQPQTQEELQPKNTANDQQPPRIEAEKSKRSTNLHERRSQQESNDSTPQEQDLLADYLAYGLSLEEAREAHRKEQELAELKHKMRENKRAIQRGAINARGSKSQTNVGPRPTPSGRGRGLTFN